MTNDHRALCAELLEALEIQLDELRFNNRLCIRARALLAQPMAEVPTDDKLMDIARATDLVYYMGEDCGFASPYMEGTDITAEVLAYARAVLAKWGTLTPQPVAVSERLPGDVLSWWYEPDEDDDEGYGGKWTLLRIRGAAYTYTHWLPANALPAPEAQ
jgi:hypothetical protein